MEATTTGTDAPPADGGKKGKRGKRGKTDAPKKGNLVPAVVIAVGLLGGGFLMGGKGGASAATAAGTEAHEEAEEEPAEPVPGEVVVLEPITLNLADGRFLKVGLALQLAAVEGEEGGEAEAAHGTEEEGGPDMGFAAKALDEAITVLGDRTYAELSAPGGRAAAKAALSEAVAARYDGAVLGVYFTELVMQ